MVDDLTLAWCTERAARVAVNRWHYSRSLPTPPRVMVGVTEAGRFIGCVIFSRGANNNLHRPFGVNRFEVCELARIALSEHRHPVTQIMAGAVRLLRSQSPKLRVVVSYADPFRGHAGIIYQAANWLYLGRTAPDKQYVDSAGKHHHSRMVSSSGIKRVYGRARVVPRPSDCDVINLPGKHRYALPLDRKMRRQLLPNALPYPRAESIESDAPADQAGQGGATPTSALPIVHA